MNEENNELLAALDSVAEVKVGDVVKGEVLAIDDNRQVIVGIEGAGVEGVIPLRELTTDRDADVNDLVKVGDVLDLVVVSTIGSDKEGGSYLLSKRRLEARRAWEEIASVPNVAEVENLLMLEPVIKTVAKRLMKDEENVFEQVKENVVHLFEKDLDSQVILHAKHLVRKKLETSMDRKINTKEELANHVESIRDNIDVDTIYETIKKEFSQYITTKDYQSILRVYNQKGMLPQSRLCAICGISTKESYLNFILSILKENKEDAQVIRQAIKASFGL